MRLKLIAAVSTAALFAGSAMAQEAEVQAGAEAQAEAAAPAAPAATGEPTDAEAGQFAAAMTAVQPIAQSLNGAAPSAEQQAQMASAIESSGLTLARFNEISGAIGQDQHLQARVGLAAAQSSQ